MGLTVKLHRTQANVETGQTGFALALGYGRWDVELQDLHQLFAHNVLPVLLALEPGAMVPVVLRAQVKQEAACGDSPQ